MRRRASGMGALALGLALCLPAAAEEGPAAEIARKSRERGALNLLDLEAELKLTTAAKDGSTREQVLATAARRIDGRVRSISRFSAPPSVAGVAVLSVEGDGAEGDELSLWLPKLRRVRKVARSQRGESFMQTDFSYADLGAPAGVQDQDLARDPDEVVEGRPAFVLRGRAGAGSPYGAVRIWVDQETFVPLKAEYRDKEGKPFKAYRALKLRRFGERTLAASAVMENLQTGSRTTVEILRLGPSRLPDDAFTERALERG